VAYSGTTSANTLSASGEAAVVYPYSFYEEGHWSKRNPSKRPISHVSEIINADNLSGNTTTSQDEKPEGYWTNRYTSKNVTSYVAMLSEQRGDSGNVGGSFVDQISGRKRNLEELEPNGNVKTDKEVVVGRSRSIEKDPYKSREIDKSQMKTIEFVKRNDEVVAERKAAPAIIEETIKHIIREKELERQGILPARRDNHSIFSL